MLSPWLYFIIKTLFTGDKHPFPVTGVMSSEKTSLSLLLPSIKLVLLSVRKLPLTLRHTQDKVPFNSGGLRRTSIKYQPRFKIAACSQP